MLQLTEGAKKVGKIETGCKTTKTQTGSKITEFSQNARNIRSVVAYLT